MGRFDEQLARLLEQGGPSAGLADPRLGKDLQAAFLSGRQISKPAMPAVEPEAEPLAKAEPEVVKPKMVAKPKSLTSVPTTGRLSSGKLIKAIPLSQVKKSPLNVIKPTQKLTDLPEDELLKRLDEVEKLIMA